MDHQPLQIRSYRVCFRLERRIHKVDRWRIPLPYGLPLRGLAYAAAGLAAALVLTELPLLGALFGLLHPAVRFLVLPLGVAVMVTRLSIDGRSAHRAGFARLRFALAPKRVSACRSAPLTGPVRLGEIAVAHDERGARLSAAVVDGPATVVIRYPVRMKPRGRALLVNQESDQALWRGKQVSLSRRQRMVVG